MPWLATAPKLIEQVHEGISGKDSQNTSMAAHSLKSSSANLGAQTLAEVCRRLEEMAREDRLEETLELDMEMDRIYAQVKAELNILLTEPTN